MTAVTAFTYGSFYTCYTGGKDIFKLKKAIEQEANAMERDDRDILDLMKLELDFLEKGGYGRSVRTPWLPTSVFQDSPSCLCYPDHSHADACVLMRFVPTDQRAAGVPCHRIPLNEAGDTLESLEQQGNRENLEKAYKDWLRVRISEIEEERARQT